jgi:hypothetical protein
MTHEVLESSKWLNGNILGKLFNQYKWAYYKKK